MKTILAIDPGMTTGIALGVQKEGFDPVGEQALPVTYDWEFAEITFDPDSWGPPAQELFRWMGESDTIIVEDYTTERADRTRAWSAEVIGTIRCHAAQFGRTTLYFQPPGVQQIVSDNMLMRTPLWRSSAHERSALKHALYYLYKHHRSPYVEDLVRGLISKGTQRVLQPTR